MAIITQPVSNVSVLDQEPWNSFLDQRGITKQARLLSWRVMNNDLWVPYPNIPELVIEKPCHYRYRKSPDSKFKSPKGSTAQPYYIVNDNSKEVCLGTEGEVDAATAVGAGYSVLSVPGASTWNPDWWKLLSRYKKVVLFVEPDVGGVTLLKRMSQEVPQGIRHALPLPCHHQRGKRGRKAKPGEGK